MPNQALSDHRRRQRARGLRRLELQVPEADAALLRAVASALTDPARASEARRTLREHFPETATPSLKALLESAPLEGVPLDRASDPGRQIDL